MDIHGKLQCFSSFLGETLVGQYAEILCETNEMMVESPKSLGRLRSLPASYIPTVEPKKLVNCLQDQCIAVRFQQTHQTTPKQATFRLGVHRARLQGPGGSMKHQGPLVYLYV